MPDEAGAPNDSTSELRRDLVSGNSALVNPARAGRPHTVSARTVSTPRGPETRALDGSVDPDCPFCWGNESATAEELVRVGPGAPGTPGWQVRVVRNRYPVLGGSDDESGRCEVVVFREHDRRLEDLDVAEVARILEVVRDRIAVQTRAGRAAVQVFVNVERDAGASIAHPHAQLISLDFEPPALTLEFDMMAGSGPDPVRADLALAEAEGLVVVDADIAAWCPAAMPFPYGVRIAPKVPGAPFRDLDATTVASVAQTLRDVLRSMNDLLDRPAYNVVVFADQTRDGSVRRWRLEAIPRINVEGGFEIGTAVTTHSVPAATAADALRSELLRRGESPISHNSGRDLPIRTYS